MLIVQISDMHVKAPGPKSPRHWGMEPPACLVHKWFGADIGALITHTSYIGD